MLDFIVCDLETTGLNLETDKIIEIAMVKVQGGKIAETYHTLVNPHCKLPLKIKRLTGIDDSQLENSPTLEQVLPGLNQFMQQNMPLVGHNIEFDRSFLAANLTHLPFTTFIDTLELARIVLPDAPSHSLSNLVQLLKLEQRTQHRALDDTLSTTELFFYLIDMVSCLTIDVLHHLLPLLKQGRSSIANLVEYILKNKLKNFASEKIKHTIPLKDPDLVLEEDASLNILNQTEFEIENLLGINSPLNSLLPNYAFRHEQVQMAQAVECTLLEQKVLLIEAGTGTGKSIAYLLPTLLWALQHEQRAIIATNTINLQEQIWHKDIPLLQRLLNITFKTALLKGRSNYLCLRRFFNLVNTLPSLTPSEAMLMARIIIWLQKTETGDKSELNLFGIDNESWMQLCSESDSCLGNGCRWSNNYCFVNRARRNAENAHLVIINHSLLFADMVSDVKILPSHEALVMDEAHNIEDTAYKHIGKRISRLEIIQWLSLTSRNLRKLIELAPPQDGNRWRTAVNKAEDARKGLLENINIFFNNLVQAFDKYTNKNYSRTRIRLHEEMQVLEKVEADYQNLLYQIRHFLASLKTIADWLEVWTATNSAWEDKMHDINNNINTGTSYQESLDFIMKSSEENYVCWVEIPYSGNHEKGSNCILHATPIDISEILFERLFNTPRSIVLTSATMTVNQKFDHFIKQCGLDRMPEQVETKIIQSPFNYDYQCLLCIAHGIPAYNGTNNKIYLDALASTILSLSLETGGRTLVLFTSHKLLKETYHKVKYQLDDADICLLGHNIDGGRSKLVDQFKMNRRSVLFGAFSFWEGVDIPGDALVNVIIVKLPFAPPDDPVLEARNEKIVAQGMNSFYNLSLPNAVIRFKQGFGRLIRSEQDRGAVIILDKRIIEKKYGRIFLNSLPVKSHVRGDIDIIRKKIAAWI